MGSHGAFQDAVLPSSLDDYSAVKSKWVVMQHSKKNSNLHDLASVPDFELLDSGWLDNTAPVEPVGKPTKAQAPQYEVVVAGGEQGVGSNAGAGASKDGELETILNPDTEAEAARTPPPPLFRDDEMESWLLATFSDPVESVLDSTSNATPEKRNPLAVSPLRPTRVLSGGSTGSGRPGESARKADAESARRGGEAEAPVPHSAPRVTAKQEEHTTEPLAAPLHGASTRTLSPAAQQHQLNAMRAQQQEAQLLRSQQQRLAHQQQQQQQQQLQQQQREEEEERERLLVAQEQELLALRQMQLRHEEEAREEQRAQALHRQIHHHHQQQQQHQQQLQQQQQAHEQQQQQQQQQQQELQLQQQQEQEHMRMLEEEAEEQCYAEEMGPPAARGHTGAQAPLNFAHFSRAAHLYSRGHLRNSTASGAPSRPPVAPTTSALPPHIAASRPLGAATKLAPAAPAKYTSVPDTDLPSPHSLAPSAGRGPASGAPGRMQGEEPHVPLRQSSDVAGSSARKGHGLIGTVGTQYAPRSRDTSTAGGSQERAHTSTVTTSMVGGAPERRGHGEREATSRGGGHLGPVDTHMAGGGGSMSTCGGGAMSRGAATEFSGRSSAGGGGVRMVKRGRETETEYTVSEGGDDLENALKVKKLLSGQGSGEDSALGGPENSAAKRARAAEVHNLSERRRRDRINERMRMLQELIPNSNKTDKASMLDEAIEYLKMLQLQLQVMSMRSGMSIPANLVPGASTGTLPSPGASSLTQLQGGEDPHSLPMASLGADPLADLPSAMPGCPDLGPGLGEIRAGFGLSDMVSGYGSGLGAGMGLEREMSGMGVGMGSTGMSMRELMMLRAGAGAATEVEGGGVGGMPARQRLLMEMMQADIQEQQHMLLQQRQHQQQQQQQHQQHQQQQQFLMQQQQQAASKSASPLDPSQGLARPPMSRSSLSGLPPHISPLGAIPKAEMLSRASSLGAQLPSPGNLGAGAYGHYPGSLRGSMGAGAGASLPGAGMGMVGDGMPGVGSMGAMAAAAVMLEGHRQLHPSAVDPLDVYLVRQQRMQQQQLQLQQEEEHQQQQQQAAVDYQMYQAILKRQQQAP